MLWQLNIAWREAFHARLRRSAAKPSAGSAVPLAERERLYPHLQLVTLPLGKVLYESRDVLRHVYFPTDSIVSLLYVLRVLCRG
jgi:hypothetical protein